MQPFASEPVVNVLGPYKEFLHIWQNTGIALSEEKQTTLFYNYYIIMLIYNAGLLILSDIFAF